MNSPYRLEEHGLSVSSEVELKDEIICTPAMGVVRSKGTVRNESLITFLEVFGDHSLDKEHSSEISCV